MKRQERWGHDAESNVGQGVNSSSGGGGGASVHINKHMLLIYFSYKKHSYVR